MPVHPLDYEIQSHLYSTPEYNAVFEEKARFQQWLSFEAALAQSQAELGIIPAAAAAEISKNAQLDKLDLAKIKLGYQKSRNSLMPVIKQLKAACKDDLGEYVHFGATTQDALDTGYILELQEAFALMRRDLLLLEKILLDLAERHKTTPMVGRTHSQQAIPITFGFKAAIWLQEVHRHLDRLNSLRQRVLTGQLSGAVGTMAALGDKAFQVIELTMAKLGLQVSLAPWHTSRDNIAEVGSFYAMLTGTLTKICNEIFQLGKTEIAELREPAAGGGPMSSTMPHKRNPVLCERVSALNSHVRSLNTVIIESMVHENERDPRSLWAEWLALPQISIYTGASLAYTIQILAGLEVLPDNMLANLHKHKDTISSEWLLFTLAEEIGKMRAQEEVYRIIQAAAEEGMTIKERLLADPELGPLMSKRDLSIMDRPEKYIGQSANIVDQVITEVLKS